MEENKKETLLQADHVKVYFKGKSRKDGAVKAVDDVSLEIRKGETFGVVGESGCGKSTLGRTLIRLIDPTDGHIYLNGEDRRMQFLAQMSPCVGAVQEKGTSGGASGRRTSGQMLDVRGRQREDGRSGRWRKIKKRRFCRRIM